MKPTPEALARLEQFTRDDEFLQRHYQEWLEQYPEQWVAVYGERLVGANPDLEQLMQDLEAQGLPLGEVCKEFLTREEEFWELVAVA